MPGSDSPTKDAILDAAERLFADRGFARTTIKDIGQAAGANPALLYYYFGNKAELYRAVLWRLADGLTARGKERLEAGADPEDVIRAVIQGQAKTISAHPHLTQLFFRELVENDATFAQPMIDRVLNQLFRPLATAISRGAATGQFRSMKDPRLAVISTIAQVVYFALAKPIARSYLDRGPEFPSQNDLEEFARHAAEFAIAALRSEQGSNQSTTAIPGEVVS